MVDPSPDRRSERWEESHAPEQTTVETFLAGCSFKCLSDLRNAEAEGCPECDDQPDLKMVGRNWVVDSTIEAMPAGSALSPSDASQFTEALLSKEGCVAFPVGKQSPKHRSDRRAPGSISASSRSWDMTRLLQNSKTLRLDHKDTVLQLEQLEIAGQHRYGCFKLAGNPFDISSFTARSEEGAGSTWMGLLGTADPVAFKAPAAVLQEGVQRALQKVRVSELDQLSRLTDSLEDYEIIHRWWGLEVHDQNLRYQRVAEKKGHSDPLSCPMPLICRSIPSKSVSLHQLHGHAAELRTIKRHLEKSLMSDVMVHKFSQLQLPGMRSHVVLACLTALHLILHKDMRESTPVRSSQTAFVICGTPSAAELRAAWNVLLKNDDNFNLNMLL
eukprot:gene2793-3585_t